MSAPAIIYLVLVGIGLLLSARGHGKPKTGMESFWSTLISVSICISLLWWGGFFAVKP